MLVVGVESLLGGASSLEGLGIDLRGSLGHREAILSDEHFGLRIKLEILDFFWGLSKSG